MNNNLDLNSGQQGSEVETSVTAALRLSERQRFQQRLARATSQASDWNGVLEVVAKILSEASGSQLVVVVRSGSTPAEATIDGLTAPLDKGSDELRQRLALFALSACRSASTQVQGLQGNHGNSVVSVPLMQSEAHFEALQLLHDFADAGHRDRVVSLVELTGSALREWRSNSVSRSLQSRLDVTTALVDLLLSLIHI